METNISDEEAPASGLKSWVETLKDITVVAGVSGPIITLLMLLPYLSYIHYIPKIDLLSSVPLVFLGLYIGLVLAAGGSAVLFGPALIMASDTRFRDKYRRKASPRISTYIPDETRRIPRQSGPRIPRSRRGVGLRAFLFPNKYELTRRVGRVGLAKHFIRNITRPGLTTRLSRGGRFSPSHWNSGRWFALFNVLCLTPLIGGLAAERSPALAGVILVAGLATYLTIISSLKLNHLGTESIGTGTMAVLMGVIIYSFCLYLVAQSFAQNAYLAIILWLSVSFISIFLNFAVLNFNVRVAVTLVALVAVILALIFSPYISMKIIRFWSLGAIPSATIYVRGDSAKGLEMAKLLGTPVTTAGSTVTRFDKVNVRLALGTEMIVAASKDAPDIPPTVFSWLFSNKTISPHMPIPLTDIVTWTIDPDSSPPSAGTSLNQVP